MVVDVLRICFKGIRPRTTSQPHVLSGAVEVALQPGDVTVQATAGIGRWIFVPHLADERLGGNRLARRHQKDGQNMTFLGPPQVTALTSRPKLDRTENAEFHSIPLPGGSGLPVWRI